MCDKYLTTIANLKQTLDEYGVAIIPSVLDDAECDAIVSEIWDFFEHITQKWEIPINRNAQVSWTEFYKLFPIHSMLIQYWNVGHSQACWDVRQNPKIIEIFEHFWKTPDLQVSFATTIQEFNRKADSYWLRDNGEPWETLWSTPIIIVLLRIYRCPATLYAGLTKLLAHLIRMNPSWCVPLTPNIDHAIVLTLSSIN